MNLNEILSLVRRNLASRKNIDPELADRLLRTIRGERATALAPKQTIRGTRKTPVVDVSFLDNLPD